MKRQTGFTLVELMVVLAILGIMSASAIPLYRTFQQRTYGSEASIMMKSLIEGEILYYLDKNVFFPNQGDPKIIPPVDPPTAQTSVDLDEVRNALNIEIPVGRFLEYTIVNNGDTCSITIKASFPLFKGGYNSLFGVVDKEGKTTIFPATL